MRAVIYVRVSTADQVQNYSLETQERSCVEYCDRERIEVAKIFREEGESAKTADRPRLQEMLEYCGKNGPRLDFVIVYRVDRLARQVHDHAAIRMALTRLDIRVRAVQETFDDSAAGRLIENLMASVAQFDNDVRATRTIDGMKQALTHGRWMWRPPIGYLKAPERRSSPSLILDEAVAPLVRLAFKLVAEGATRHDAWEHVTALGLRTRRGEPLSLQSFGALLRNPLYAGRIVLPKWDHDGDGDFDALVSRELFDAAQREPLLRGTGSHSRRLDHPDFPLRRQVRCGACGAPLTGSWSRGRSGKYPYYRCPKSGCSGVNVRKERLEALFIDELKRLSARKEVFALLGEIVQDTFQSRESAALEARGHAESRLRDLVERENRLVDALVHDKAIDQSTYDQQRARLTREKDRLLDAMSTGPTVDTDINAALSFAWGLLEDLPGCWNRLTSQHRAVFLRIIFPEGLTYRDGAIGTAHPSWLFGVFGPEEDAQEALVAPTGFEPVTPP